MASTALQWEEPTFQYPSFEEVTGHNFAGPNGEKHGYNPDFFGFKISDALGFTNYKGEYEQYVNDKNRAYEQYDAATARAFNEYLDSTKYQRAAKDLEAIGINPWVLTQQGVSSAASGNVGTHSSAKQSSNFAEKSNGSKLSAIAMMLMATAKLVAAGIL